MKKILALILFCPVIHSMDDYVSLDTIQKLRSSNPYNTSSYHINVLCTRCKQIISYNFKYNYRYEKNLIAITCPKCKYANQIEEKKIKSLICNPNLNLRISLSENKKIVLHKIHKFETTLEESLERITSQETKLEKVNIELSFLEIKHGNFQSGAGVGILEFLSMIKYKNKRAPHIEAVLSHLKNEINETIWITKPMIKQEQKNKKYYSYHRAIKNIGKTTVFSLVGLATYHCFKKIIRTKKRLPSFLFSLGSSVLITGIANKMLFKPYSKKCKKYEEKYNDEIFSLKQKKRNALILKEIIEDFEKKYIQPQSFRKKLRLNKKNIDSIVTCQS